MNTILSLVLVSAYLFSGFASPLESAGCAFEWYSTNCADDDPYNGYWWWGGGWIPGIPTLDTYFRQTPTVMIGDAVFYAPQVMAATAELRGLSLSGYVGGVSGLFPSDIGTTVWLQRPGHEWEGPFLVVDCARLSDLYGVVVHRNEVIEVDFDTAVRWGMAMYGGPGNDGRWTALQWRIQDVKVSKYPPAHADREAVNLEQWFLDGRVDFTLYPEGRVVYRSPSTWLMPDNSIRTFRQPRLPVERAVE